jgi:daunorubicin resistance ABC transporter ATP-binding subunit
MNSHTPSMAVEAHELRKRYGETQAADGISLSVPAGSVFGLLGPNGAGKTTTVRMLATLLAPDSGSARIAGFDVITEANEVRRNIGLVGQYASVDELLSGRQNLIMIGRLHGLSRSGAKRRADELLERFDLDATGNKAASTYSGGMRRRLDLAASLVIKPPVLFLDEPTTGLDPTGRAATWDVIADMTRDGTTVLLTTQYLDEADRFASRVAVIDHGRVVAEGTPAGLKSRVGRASLAIQMDQGFSAVDLAEIVTPFAFSAPFPRGAELIVPLRDLTVTADLMAALAEAGVALNDVSVVKPSMDDVFFELTGQRATADTAKELAA